MTGGRSALMTRLILVTDISPWLAAILQNQMALSGTILPLASAVITTGWRRGLTIPEKGIWL